MVTVTVHHGVAHFIFVVVVFFLRREDIEVLVIDKRHLAVKTDKPTNAHSFG